MRFRTHLLASFAVGLALFPQRPLRLAATVAAGTLIDLDHLLLYGLHTGDWSIVGALRYDRYRHRGAEAGDSRPRYGSLRSWLHEPALLLPLAALAGARPAMRPLAAGLGLHLLLDHYDWPWRVRARLRAGGVCGVCGRRGRRLRVSRSGPPGAWRYQARCAACSERAARAGRA
ncbi:MAG: hypothetical protein OHK0015_51660 [Chloroflexi bacterium OHK40]